MSRVIVCVLIASLGCGINDVTNPLPSNVPPIGNDTISIPAPSVPPSNIMDITQATPRDITWEEKWPHGFHFAWQTMWGTPVQDTTAFRYGWKSQKFSVSAGECFGTDCYRQPVYERKEIGEGLEGLVTEGDERWYGWSFYVPRSSKNPWVYFGQLIQPPNDTTGVHIPMFFFFKRHNHPFCLVVDPRNRIESEAFTCNSPPNISLLTDSEFAGKWHDVVLRVIVSTTNGLAEVWVDGEFKGRYEGRTLHITQKGVVFKYGIYRIAADGVTTIYYDELRTATIREEVDIRYLTQK
jgi:hypothetical protein